VKYLIVGDTPSVKKFVFGTSKLKEIKGTSAILDYLNRHETPRIAEKIWPGVEIIYANGGTFQLIFDADSPEQKDASYLKFKTQLQKQWNQRTEGGSRAKTSNIRRPWLISNRLLGLMQSNQTLMRSFNADY